MTPGKQEPVTGILVAHGGLAVELKRTAESIAGPADDLDCFSNDDVAPEALAAAIGRFLDGRNGPAVVMVDLAGGSCLSAALRASRGRAGVAVIAGVNLPLVLDFLQKRDVLPMAELLEHLVDRGRGGIRMVTPGE